MVLLVTSQENFKLFIQHFTFSSQVPPILLLTPLLTPAVFLFNSTAIALPSSLNKRRCSKVAFFSVFLF